MSVFEQFKSIYNSDNDIFEATLQPNDIFEVILTLVFLNMGLKPM